MSSPVQDLTNPRTILLIAGSAICSALGLAALILGGITARYSAEFISIPGLVAASTIAGFIFGLLTSLIVLTLKRRYIDGSAP